MRFNGERHLRRPVAHVWDALHDSRVLGQTIPGCRSLVPIDAGRYAATLAARVGPVSDTYRGAFSIEDLSPGSELRVRVEGRGRCGRLVVDLHVALTARCPETTTLRYDAHATVAGFVARAMQHELERVRTQQRDQYMDIDTRLRAAEAALTAAQATTAPGSPEAEYQAAFNLLKDGRYEEAETALREFAAKYPQHELAANAVYWLGEAHYVQRDYPAALAAFESVLRDYPGTRKSPDALLKAGYCQYELRRYGDARTLLTRVVQEFPDTQAAADARARLERLPAEGG